MPFSSVHIENIEFPQVRAQMNFSESAKNHKMEIVRAMYKHKESAKRGKNSTCKTKFSMHLAIFSEKFLTLEHTINLYAIN